MLASDREREAALSRLRAAHVEGRIDAAELEARAGRAHAARTQAELAAVTADLPARIEVRPTRGVPRLPGRRRFAERRVVDGTVAEVRERLLGEILPSFARAGFYVHRATEDAIAVENRARVGSRFAVRLADAGDHRTLLVVEGAAPLSVRRAFAAL